MHVQAGKELHKSVSILFSCVRRLPRHVDTIIPLDSNCDSETKTVFDPKRTNACVCATNVIMCFNAPTAIQRPERKDNEAWDTAVVLDGPLCLSQRSAN